MIVAAAKDSRPPGVGSEFDRLLNPSGVPARGICVTAWFIRLRLVRLAVYGVGKKFPEFWLRGLECANLGF